MKKIILCLFLIAISFGISAQERKNQIEIIGAMDFTSPTSFDLSSDTYVMKYQPMQLSLRSHFNLVDNLNLFVAINSMFISTSINIGVSTPLYLGENTFFHFTASGVLGRSYVKGLGINIDQYFYGGELGASINHELFDFITLIAGVEAGLTQVQNREENYSHPTALGYRTAFYIGLGFRH